MNVFGGARENDGRVDDVRYAPMEMFSEMKNTIRLL